MSTPAGVAGSRVAVSPAALGLALGLLALTAVTWILTLRGASSMTMPTAGAPSVPEGTLFTLQWGVMMAAMMVPSAAPMIMLYRTVSGRLAASGDRVIPAWSFAFVYLLSWLALGVPLYLAYVMVGAAAARWAWVDAAIPYGVAGVLAMAGLYQFTDAKRSCLRQCESPLQFLMQRWRSGNRATLWLATQHAGYCIGCCWALMAILVVAGAMSIPWVVSIALLVFAEKTLPYGARVGRVVGIAFILLGLAVAMRPALARRIRGSPTEMPGHLMTSGAATGRLDRAHEHPSTHSASGIFPAR